MLYTEALLRNLWMRSQSMHKPFVPNMWKNGTVCYGSSA